MKTLSLILSNIGKPSRTSLVLAPISWLVYLIRFNAFVVGFRMSLAKCLDASDAFSTVIGLRSRIIKVRLVDEPTESEYLVGRLSATMI